MPAEDMLPLPAAAVPYLVPVDEILLEHADQGLNAEISLFSLFQTDSSRGWSQLAHRLTA